MVDRALDHFQLRAYAYLDRLQPQYAAFVGGVTEGDPAVEGMASVYVEMAPANWVFRVVNDMVKATDVRIGAQVVEREFGSFEVHSSSQSDVLRAGEVLEETLGLSIDDRMKPTVVSEQVITNVHPRQAQVLNRSNQGTMIVGGHTLLVLEVQPAAYITYAANEAEKAAPIFVNHLDFYGMYGRMWLSGTESDIWAARDAARTALSQI